MIINENQSVLFVIILGIALVALFITRRLMKSSFPFVFIGIVGLILGLLVGALLAIPVGRLPGDYGKWLPMIVHIFATVAVLDLFLGQARGFSRYFRSVTTGNTEIGGVNLNLLPEILLDTSSIIDGRILEVAETGFIMMPFAVPTFVIDELQLLADSRDSIKRDKGKRGLEILEALKSSPKIVLRVIDQKNVKGSGVDAKLIWLAKDLGSRIVTTDTALNRSATIQGVAVLNLNDVAGALKSVVYPGEVLRVLVAQKGKERGQGIGYMVDGSMVVIEDGDKLVGKEINCKVVRVFQTSSGRMLFAEKMD